MLRFRDLRLLRRTSRGPYRSSPVFGIFVFAAMMILGGSALHQYTSLKPFLGGALAPPATIAVQHPRPVGGPTLGPDSGAPSPEPALAAQPLVEPTLTSRERVGTTLPGAELADAMLIGATDTFVPLDEAPVEAASRAALLYPSDPPTGEPILVPVEESELPQPTATLILEPTVAPTLVPTAISELRQVAMVVPQLTTAQPATMPKAAQALPELSVASTAPVRVVAPSIDLDQPVVTVGWHQETVNNKLVSVWDVAQFAVGWHKNSSLPGQGGNVVLAGHNNIYGEVFKRLDELESGDIITVYADGRGYDYEVESAVIVREEGATPEEKAANVRWIGSFPDERLTLVACYPYTGNSHRILIIARPRFKVS